MNVKKEKDSQIIFILMISFPICLILFCSFFLIDFIVNKNEQLPSQPILYANFNDLGYSNKLKSLSINHVQLTCEKNKKMSMKIEFKKLEGREPVNVITDSFCEKPGNMFKWFSYSISARENYSYKLITDEINKVIEKNKVSINIYNKDEPEISDMLIKNFASASKEKKFTEVLFTCDKKGDFYSYKSDTGFRNESKEGKLKIVCEGANQNFEINNKLEVHTYNQVSSEIIKSAYKDFLGGDEKLNF